MPYVGDDAKSLRSSFHLPHAHSESHLQSIQIHPHGSMHEHVREDPNHTGSPQTHPLWGKLYCHHQQYPSPPAMLPWANSAPTFSLVEKLHDMKPSEYATGLIHLYRAEMQRLTVYRTRLDMTTNWCVTTVAGLTVLTLGNSSIAHWFHFMILFFVLIFLILEARRYSFYRVSRFRVRMLEKGFYGRVMTGKGYALDHWDTLMWSSYNHPQVDITLLRSMIVRFRRIYVYILAGILLSWTAKVVSENVDMHWGYFVLAWGLFACIALPLPFVYHEQEADV